MERIASMKKAREEVHTFLLSYNNIRSRIGQQSLIFVLEGREDIPVYDIWIKRELKEEISEPLAVNGKANVIALSDLISNSEEILNERVIFCADRDFDEHDPDLTSNIYITSTYSVENLLISKDSIERIFLLFFDMSEDDIHSRTKLGNKFTKLLLEFNNLMLFPNACARFARINHIPSINGFPDKIKDLVKVTLDNVSPKLDVTDPQTSVKYLNLRASPLPNELAEHINYLKRSDLTTVGRGKFLLDFVRKFLALALEDKQAKAPRFFQSSNRSLADPCQHLLNNLANAAPTPNCFKIFIQLRSKQWAVN